MNLYFHLRISEVKSDMPENQKEMLRRDCTELNQVDKNIVRAVVFFERMIGKTLDNPGSLNYYIKVREKALQMDEAEFANTPLTYEQYIAALEPRERQMFPDNEPQDEQFARGSLLPPGGASGNGGGGY